VTAGDTPGAVAVAPVRHWISERQNATRDTGSLLGNVYFGLLLAITLVGICWPMVHSVFWPDVPSGGWLTAAALPLVSAGALHLGLRQIGPLAVSRPAASWLLTAPVSRRALLAPSARVIVAASALAGTTVGFATASQVTQRPTQAAAIVFATLGGTLFGVAVALGATVAQRLAGWGRIADGLAYAALGLGIAGLVVNRTVQPGRAGLRLAEAPIGYAVAALAVAVLVVGALAYRRLDRTHPETILAAAQATGTIADATAGGQPSFVTDLVERRFWAGRRWRSAPLAARIPVLLGQDLRVLGRRRRRLVWVAAASVLPGVIAGHAGWLLAAAVLVGAMAAAATSTSTVRADAANPAMLRLLAVSARHAVLDRTWLPVALASAWAATALTVVTALDGMPPGPWWALGLAIGPAAAAGAIRRSRMGLVQNGLLPLDTPMGSIESGPVMGALIGYDLLILFTLPALVDIGTANPLTWTGVLTQLVFSVAGLTSYLGVSTHTDAADLKTR
jgi:hypothetical protein